MRDFRGALNLLSVIKKKEKKYEFNWGNFLVLK